jgi:hypothetical protein
MNNNTDTPKNNDCVTCYISSKINRNIDSELEKIGISKGIISFAVPNYGIQFKCRSEGLEIDMEFAAFFSLLEFIVTKMKNEKIRKVHINSSMPHFVFAFTGMSEYLKENSPYKKLLSEYSKKMIITIGYVKQILNDSVKSPSLYPSMPKDKSIKLDFDKSEMFKKEFKSIQKGIRL